MHIEITTRRAAAAIALCLGVGAVQAVGQQAGQGTKSDLTAKPAQRAGERVSAAVAVVHLLESEPRMKLLLQHARGVLIVPSYARAALGVGAQGGGGLAQASAVPP